MSKETVICRKCGCTLTTETWYHSQQKQSSRICKTCDSAKAIAYKKRFPWKTRANTIRARCGADIWDTDLINIFQNQNSRCTLCGKVLDENGTLHIDHIEPLSKGGTTTVDNLQILCVYCNIGKYDLSVDDYITHCLNVVNHTKQKGI